MQPPRIVITSGEPAGIGPDACIMLAQSAFDAELVIAGDAELLRSTATSLGCRIEIEAYRAGDPPMAQRPGVLRVLHMPLHHSVVAGRLDVRNAPYVIALLDRACDGCSNGEFAAMVTAPVQKSILLEAGFTFSGHTEYLAHRLNAPLPVMLLLDQHLRVALVTTHLPLAAVPAAITPDRLLATLRIVDVDMKRYFAMPAPRIAVLGLNPHAGESGHLGREEIDVIEPCLARLRSEGLNVFGPVPADTAFTPRFLESADVIVAMYHDQGLPVIKHVGFGSAVNMTLGLPILRTSVDHGTALALARSGKADAGSLIAAVRMAADLAHGLRTHGDP